MSRIRGRAAEVALWLLPVVFLVWLYRGAFSVWFRTDDFAWLSLLRRVQLRHDFFTELFAPAAQGTIRPWSERGYFMAMQALFGLDNVPFRVVALATAAADALLITWITRRITASPVAGFLAPVLWLANTVLVTPMIWSSAYNELLCPLFLLSALGLFIRYIGTGRRMFWWWQLVVFILGFGVLEINLVYPVIAAAWVVFVVGRADAGHRFRRSVAPLAGIAAVYIALHRMLAPPQTSGPYVLHFNAAIFKTLALYCKWSLVPEAIERFGYSHHRVELALLLTALGVAAFVVTELLQRRRAVLFYLAWFGITLAPLLPLSNHRTDYYPTIPLIGIAMLGGAAVGRYWNAGLMQCILTAIPIATYLWVMIPMTQNITNYWRLKTAPVRTLVLGVSTARQTHPGKAIALDGVSTELFDLSLADSPFLVTGVEDVYLTPESALTINSDPASEGSRTPVLEPDVMAHAVTHDDVVVYSLESNHLRNITEGYSRRMTGRTVDRLPTRVDVGNSLYSWLLGPTWLPPESGIRWMPGSATVRLGVPEGGSRLELDGRCPSSQLSRVPRHLMVLVDGAVAGDTRIYDPESTFHRLIPIPASVLAGKKSVEIEIRVDPVDRKDGQDYGLVFGKIAIQP